VADQTVQPAMRKQLEAERAQLQEQVAGLVRGGTAAESFDDNFADSGQVAAEQGENAVLANRLRAELDEVERALAKLDDGTYGRCEVCGEPIAEARLEAMPATRFCIDHA
jgi:RNA polymerase-binding protein DksA